MKKLLVFPLLSVVFTTMAQDQTGNNPAVNPADINNEQQFALNNDHSPGNFQVQINQNPQQQVQQRMNYNPQVQVRVNENPVHYNQQKAGQSIRITSYGGSSGISSGKAVKKSNKSSIAYKVKKAMAKMKSQHKPVRHYAKKGKKRCSKFG